MPFPLQEHNTLIKLSQQLVIFKHLDKNSDNVFFLTEEVLHHFDTSKTIIEEFIHFLKLAQKILFSVIQILIKHPFF